MPHVGRIECLLVGWTARVKLAALLAWVKLGAPPRVVLVVCNWFASHIYLQTTWLKPSSSHPNPCNHITRALLSIKTTLRRFFLDFIQLSANLVATGETCKFAGEIWSENQHKTMPKTFLNLCILSTPLQSNTTKTNGALSCQRRTNLTCKYFAANRLRSICILVSR